MTYILNLLAMLSINVGIFNLLPIRFRWLSSYLCYS
ncbi:MAG: hypothetical protein ACLUIS_00435 [Longibaculum sp.]